MESSIVDFHQDFYITKIHKPVFHLPHAFIIETDHCGNTHLVEFKRCSDFQDVLCHSDYAERVAAIFSHQIQSEYWGGKRSMSVEVLYL